MWRNLVYAQDWGSCGCKALEVQVLSSAPEILVRDRKQSPEVKVPLLPTEKGALSSMARASRLHRGGWGFESLSAHRKIEMRTRMRRGRETGVSRWRKELKTVGFQRGPKFRDEWDCPSARTGKYRRVSYSGYYTSLPRTRGGFNSRYPLKKKNLWLVQSFSL